MERASARPGPVAVSSRSTSITRTRSTPASAASRSPAPGAASDAVNYYTYDPVYMFVPGLAIFIMVLAFNLFGDGLRDALDPKANR
jgi:ABC-type antimicrobial peptide transport system permease subunit